MAMMRIFLLMAALYSANVALAQIEVKGRPASVFNGEAAPVVVDLLGGSSADFHLRDQGINPLLWGREGPRSLGHFLCLDRWASVSEVALLDDRLVVRPRPAAAGAVERTNADLVMEVDALFIE